MVEEAYCQLPCNVVFGPLVKCSFVYDTHDKRSTTTTLTTVLTTCTAHDTTSFFVRSTAHVDYTTVICKYLCNTDLRHF